MTGYTQFANYPAMLGARLASATFQTDDVDIAQFKEVSVAVEDAVPPMLDVLRSVDPTFHPIPHISDGRRVTRYQGRGQLRVDFLTPNRGPDDAGPQRLPALRTDAEPLRFLDYLIRDPEPAVVLHGLGIYVSVPAPERFAVHKLIVARRRSVGSAKREKDVKQADSLVAVLSQKRPYELLDAWKEAEARGAIWRKLLEESRTMLPEKSQARLSETLGRR